MKATIHTSMGDIAVELFEADAPQTVANFVGLANGSKEWTDPLDGMKRTDPLYNGTTFHRVIKNFMIQGGDPLGNGTGGPGYSFNDEINQHKFDQPYMLAMANAGLRRDSDGKVHGTNGSQFFITTVPTPWLNGHHTIFGQVTDAASQKVVTEIDAVATGRGDQPLEPVFIESIEVAE
ncbi:peptidylprolyl isomerase [Parascardovia denticolens]